MEKWRGEWVERGWVPPWKERLIPNLCAPRKGGEEVSIQMAEVLRECWCVGDVRVHVSIDLWHTALFRQNHLKPLFSLLEAWCGTTAVTNPSLVATKDLTLGFFLTFGWTQVLRFHDDALALGPHYLLVKKSHCTAAWPKGNVVAVQVNKW